MSAEKESDYIFTWKIENFSSYYQKTGVCITSPRFRIEYLCGVKWFLKLFPKGNHQERKQYISYFLAWEKSNEAVKPVHLNFTLEISDESCVLISREVEHFFDDDEPDWGYSSMLSRNTLKERMKSWQNDVLILRCRVVNYNIGGIQRALRLDACTSLEVDRRSVEWDVTIPLSFQFSENITFTFLNTHNFEVHLTTFLEAIEIFVHLKESQQELTQHIIFKVGFFNKLGSKIAAKHAMKIFKTAGSWKYPYLITKKELEACKIGLSNFEFKLNCELYTSKGSSSSMMCEHLTFKSPFITSDLASKNTSALSMRDDFQTLFKSKKFCDVTIRAGNVDFPAHKLVLQMRSPVFAAMFEQNMIENKTGVVEMFSEEEPILGTFLEFLYMGTVGELDYEKAIRLLFIADKYQVLSLVDVCMSRLTSVMTEDNVCEIIAAADAISYGSLKSYALNFIKLHASTLLSSRYWLEWLEKNGKLATYILSELSLELSSAKRMVYSFDSES